ncbi:hypothetical protein [Microbacterium sp. 77mftsu3.1]|uniref:hypothetical protein n=1 Tax=Microbacterium sp. 77mftsu3.1 TaxID=1761802 RepID=UPI00039C8185|nr:hypothetical protein [Microbacterium sp. 77mftsu3.1]SDH55798.1 hypothetical protein SAMN04488590_3572 [Microbacterium sp. 77mftsu3.1]
MTVVIPFILICAGVIGLAALISVIAGVIGLVQGFTPAGAIALLLGVIVLSLMILPFVIGADLTGFVEQVKPPLAVPGS